LPLYAALKRRSSTVAHGFGEELTSTDARIGVNADALSCGNDYNLVPATGH